MRTLKGGEGVESGVKSRPRIAGEKRSLFAATPTDLAGTRAPPRQDVERDWETEAESPTRDHLDAGVTNARPRSGSRDADRRTILSIRCQAGGRGQSCVASAASGRPSARSPASHASRSSPWAPRQASRRAG